MNKHIYIAGPMKGLPEFNYPAFNSTEERLKKLGYNVVNPVKLSGEITPEELDANYDLLTSVMNKEQRSIAQCDSIYLLRGWEKSKGARKELAIAIMLNLEIILEERQDA